MQIRDSRPRHFFWCDNVIIDRYARQIGPYALAVSANRLYGFERFILQSVQGDSVKATFEREGQPDALLSTSPSATHVAMSSVFVTVGVHHLSA
jgi:hypothetical protein